MSLVISKVFTYDTDAGNYIQAVEAADGQALEAATRQAINNFVIGCKQDGIWSAIKASCILAGARTLNGALVPLAGTAPTNNNFVSGDYNRKTGLVGDGSTKYLNSNRAGDADPQNSAHISAYATLYPSVTGYLMGAGTINPGATNIGFFGFSFARNRNNASNNFGVNATGLVGTSRSGSASIDLRVGGSTASFSSVSQTPTALVHSVFASDTSSGARFAGRLAFYSIGESLDLAKLDTRVTALINAFGAAIP